MSNRSISIQMVAIKWGPDADATLTQDLELQHDERSILSLVDFNDEIAT